MRLATRTLYSLLESRVTGKARTARLAAAEWGGRGPREAAGGGPGRSPVY